MEWERMDKSLRDLIEIIHFTENVSAKIHGVLDEAEIYEAVREEFAQSKRYTVSILLLTDDGSKLRIAQTSIPSGKLKVGEKTAGVRLKGYKIDLNKSSIYSQVVREGKTVQVNVSDTIAELFPPPLAHLISKTMGYEKKPSILTPLKRHGQIIGAFAISSTELAEHFMPSVRNLAQHISTALELADEYAERRRAEEELREYRDYLEELVEERTAELIKANEQLEREITERKRAEEALQRHAAQLALLNDIGGKIAAVLDLDSVLDRAARLVQESFGYHHVGLFTLDRERGELVMQTRAGAFTDLFPPEHRLKLGQGMVGWVGRHGQRLLANDVDAEPRYVNLYPDVIPTRSELSVPIRVGEEIVGVLDAQSPQLNAFDESDVMVMETLADQVAVAIENARLYEAVQQELAERKRAEEGLHERERFLSSIFASIQDGLSILDKDMNIIRVNPAIERWYSYSMPLVGKKCYQAYHSRSERCEVCPSRRTLETGESAYEVVPKRGPGGEIVGWLDLYSFPLVDTATGQVKGVIEYARDITERKQLEAQLRQAQKMEALGQLAAGIAHDFNNLLTPISGFAELLLWHAPEGSQQQEYLRQIKIAAERAAALTRQLRLFTRQEGGERRPVQLNYVVKETRDLLEHSIPKEITIELRLASELWAVEADPSQISQVLMNLCVNARDAMPDGGTLTLETRNVTLDEEYAQAILEAQPGRYVCLSVLDTGCGMSPEVQARLFEPFFTTKEVGEGTGLGLAVVYGIVKGHNGFINVYSQEGRGSTFHVYLPAIELALAEKGIEGLELPTGTETILLVDDEEMVRALGRRVLERCGYTVLMAENGVQALEMYQAHQGKIGLVVLDAVMPQMGGLECLRRLREMDSQVKVLISTGYTARGLAHELVAEGALGVVEKPFLLRDFAVAVRGVLDER